MPWWTPADRAELDVLVHELVAVMHEHRGAGCETCADGGPLCPFVRAAIERVVEWREDRILRSLAEFLRAQRNEYEELRSYASFQERRQR